MKYIVCEEPGKFLMKEKEKPTRTSGEALLRIHKVGICGTDLHAYSGNQPFFTYPRILGHELSATVEAIDENTRGIQIGDKVVIMPYISCQECVACKAGKTNCCTNISVLGVHSDGGMQEYITVPSNILLPAGELKDEDIAIVEPLAIGAHALRRANIQKGEYIVVMGCGPIGIGLIKLAQLAGAEVIALDINDDRLTYVKEEIGVAHVVNITQGPLEQVTKITQGDLATAVFDATGNKKALESGTDYMAHGGRYVLVGLYKGDLVFTHPKIHAKETTLMCSRNATFEDFEHVIDVLNKGEFPTGSFVTHEVPYTDMIENFDSWLNPETGVVKAMITF